jgi:hypothetical protein
MFKKHMTPLQPHTKKGSLQSSPNKGSDQRDLADAAGGGAPNMQSYGKATPMAQPSPDDAGQGIGFGGFPGNAIG